MMLSIRRRRLKAFHSIRTAEGGIPHIGHFGSCDFNHVEITGQTKTNKQDFSLCPENNLSKCKLIALKLYHMS